MGLKNPETKFSHPIKNRRKEYIMSIMSIKNLATTTVKVVKTGAKSIICDKTAMAIAGITIGTITCIELGCVLTKREYEAKDGKEPDKSILREIWDDIGEHVVSFAGTLATCALVNGISEEVILPALRKKWPDKYPTV
jgi:hypothetical protein